MNPPFTETGYYRIKMVHFTNAISYSNEVILTPVGLMPGINIYPNPVADVLKIGIKNSKSYL